MNANSASAILLERKFCDEPECDGFLTEHWMAFASHTLAWSHVSNLNKYMAALAVMGYVNEGYSAGRISYRLRWPDWRSS